MPRVRRAWTSPKFSLLRLNCRRTAYLRAGLLTFRLTYVPAYQRSGLPTRHQLQPTWLSSITSSSGTSIFLFYVIGLSSFYKIIFLFFLPSLQLKHVM
jgi:hypothetical protein